jgi:hypothetical protein
LKNESFRSRSGREENFAAGRADIARIKFLSNAKIGRKGRFSRFPKEVCNICDDYFQAGN